ncbi:MAG: CofH family radical SAM protein [Opitutales bacterium]|nr:CofH family radical SAM protein [Opitutales bacterium]
MTLLEKVKNNLRVDVSEALPLFDMPLCELGELANIRLSFLADTKKVGYIKNRMINYSNICIAKCAFCAYHSAAKVIKPFRYSDSEILQIVDDAVLKGATQIMLQGGLCNQYDLEWAANLARQIKSKYPKLDLHIFSPSEIVYFARNSNRSVFETVKTLREAGVDSIPGAADLLIDEIREKYSPLKPKRDEWKSVMAALAKLGLKSSATMTFGMGETLAQRIEHLNYIRTVQDELNVFNAFIAWPLAPEHTKLEHIKRASAVEFLKTVAISRIFLDNIKNIQSGWLTEGMKVAEMALNFGANDFGGILMDEMVIKSAGIENTATEQGVRKMIENCGKIPFERDGLYNEI